MAVVVTAEAAVEADTVVEMTVATVKTATTGAVVEGVGTAAGPPRHTTVEVAADGVITDLGQDLILHVGKTTTIKTPHNYHID